MDGGHVRRNAGLPDKRGLSGPAGETKRGAGRQNPRHPGRVPLFCHDGHVADAPDDGRRPVGGHRPGAGLRAFDLLPAHHRSRTPHQNVGAGLCAADDGRRLDDPAGEQVVRCGRHGGGGVARNRSRTPADYLLLHAGNGRAVAQRRNRGPARKTAARLRGADRRAGRCWHSGRGVELRAALVYGPALQRNDSQRL